jgi:hypothetical protein
MKNKLKHALSLLPRILNDPYRGNLNAYLSYFVNGYENDARLAMHIWLLLLCEDNIHITSRLIKHITNAWHSILSNYSSSR